MDGSGDRKLSERADKAVTAKVVRTSITPAVPVEPGTVPPVGKKAPRLITIDPNVGLPSRDPNPDEPTGVWYTVRKSFRAFWATRETEATFTNRDLFIRTTLRELFVYILFLTSTLVITFGKQSTSMYYLNKAMDITFRETNPVNFDKLNNFEQLHEYLEKSFIEGLYWDDVMEMDGLNRTNLMQTDGFPCSTTNDTSGNTTSNRTCSYNPYQNYIFRSNKMLGLPRIRQLRVKNGSCTIPAQFKSFIYSCYSEFTEPAENRDFFGVKNITWNFTAPSMGKLGEYWGKVGTYHNGGFIQDLSLCKNETRDIIKQLIDNSWIDQGTRAIIIDITVYNANLNLFATVRLVTEFPASGGLINSISIRVSKLIQYLTNEDFVVLVFEGIFVMFILYYLGEEILELSKLKPNYFKSFWNILDLVVVVLALTCIGLEVRKYLMVDAMLEKLLHSHDQFVDFDFLSYYHTVVSDALAILAFLSWVKLFKYLSFNKTMMQLSHTLSRAAKDIFNFAIMFFIIFFAFAQLGYFLFGTRLEKYRDIGEAAITLLRVILGDFEFDELEEADRIMGPLFFFVYIFFVYFILLNMFLAIINETYAAVKEDLALSRNEFDVGGYLKKGFDRIVRRLRWGNFKKKKKEQLIVHDKVLKQKAVDELSRWQEDLRNRGYSDEEIKAVFGNQAMISEQVANEEQAAADVSAERILELEKRMQKIDKALRALLGHFETALSRLDMMERVKQNRTKKMDAIIDHLDEGEFVTNEKKEVLTAQELQKRPEKKSKRRTSP